jgi:hypothetical protein
MSLLQIETPEKLKNVFEQNESPYYFLYMGSGISPIAKNTTDKDLKTAFAKMQKAFQTYGDGTYEIELRTHPNQSRGAIKFTYKLGANSEESSKSLSTISGIGMIEKEFSERGKSLDFQNRNIFELSLDKQRLEIENDRLKDKIKDLEKAERNQSSFLAGLPKAVESLAPIIAALRGANPMVQPPPSEPAESRSVVNGFNDAPKEEQSKYDILLDKLYEVLQCQNEEEFLVALEKMVNAVEKNPIMVKNYLFS